jgi:hypothetical protein
LDRKKERIIFSVQKLHFFEIYEIIEKIETVLIVFFLKLYFEFFMNFEIVLQLASLVFILAAGPLVVVLLSARGGNL